MTPAFPPPLSHAFLAAARRPPRSCPICFDDVVGSKCVLLDCSHAFCAECFSTHCRMHTLEGSVESVRCPDPACRVQVPPHVLSKVLTQVRASRET
eukprot:365219-Chlamydomonas_euryale.AAC.32